MKTSFIFLFMLCSLFVVGQQKITGSVVDEKGNPILGANVFIEGSYDGATTNEKGFFEFTSSEKGTKVLVISFLGYETLKHTFSMEHPAVGILKIKESVNTLDAVVINAGTFEAGDKAKVTVLKPLDIVTTAGSNANIVAALQTLPGTSTVGESGRLFVRGGESDETQTFVDGIRVAQPYGASAQNLPTRGRFSPFLFSGMSFSTGGYSAEYGEALSSVLLLNTIDEPAQESTQISLMTVGLGLANTQKWNKNALTINTAYLNLEPYQAMIPQRVKWYKPYQSLSGESVYRHQFEKGLFKLYAAFDAAQFDLSQDKINAPYLLRTDLHNSNFYLNSSYKVTLGTNWQFFTGMSYALSENKINLNDDFLHNTEHASHFKARLKKSFSERVKLTFGTDYFITKFDENYDVFQGSQWQEGYQATIGAVYAETDIFFSKKLALKSGIRGASNSYIHKNAFSPRLALAYKLAKESQISLAYGVFEQAPSQDYLKYSSDFENQKATHYILNYQYNFNKRTFRAELYYKNYSNLVKYDTPTVVYNAHFTNNGTGYAQGLDLFWRDNKTIKNLEYWVSYSYIDTKRDNINYPNKVTPSFAANHNLSIVTKYWIEDWKSQIGFSHTFNSGRPYNDYNQQTFMNGLTKPYNNLSFNWAYLISQQKIVYFSVTNVLGTKNVYGYEYANSPDANGYYNSTAITPTADRFLFLGFFWTISDNKKENQLNNL
ncbi:TonB-dependent receptor [Flavobacterium aciduliphilum]|uniref:Outer membrane cobalamin receptor n=1 Tax=Flavobacterium aciduliphilum TaxID=1101402 RepID=A0A328Y873_9FLAO|nr:TonB-dependent receptor [Flavobacterium aciduliphilum]RAR70109.1 outer membrane cobalamin receptor [Flavobacterium aciduliphilum]